MPQHLASAFLPQHFASACWPSSGTFANTGSLANEANKALASLNLGYTGIDDLDAQQLANALRRGAALTRLTLYGNSITNEGTLHRPSNP